MIFSMWTFQQFETVQGNPLMEYHCTACLTSRSFLHCQGPTGHLVFWYFYQNHHLFGGVNQYLTPPKQLMFHRGKTCPAKKTCQETSHVMRYHGETSIYEQHFYTFLMISAALQLIIPRYSTVRACPGRYSWRRRWCSRSGAAPKPD